MHNYVSARSENIFRQSWCVCRRQNQFIAIYSSCSASTSSASFATATTTVAAQQITSSRAFRLSNQSVAKSTPLPSLWRCFIPNHISFSRSRSHALVMTDWHNSASNLPSLTTPSRSLSTVVTAATEVTVTTTKTAAAAATTTTTLCSYADLSPKKIWLFPSSNRRNHLPQHSRRWFSQTSGNIVSFNLSDIGEGIGEVVIKEWFVKQGDKVNQFDAICEVQSDKASVTITSRYDGVIHKIYYEIDDIAKVGLPLVDFQIDGTESTGETKASVDAKPSDKFDDDYSPVNPILTTPAVRRLAMEHKIDLKDVLGTGKEGRILKEDVLNYLNQPKAIETSATLEKEKISHKTENESEIKTKKASSVSVRPAADLPADRVEAIKGITKAMLITMTQSLSVPHFGLSEEIDMTELVRLRPLMKVVAEERAVAISYMPFMIKAASLALNDFPILNASIDTKNETIVYKGAHNIGVAMDTKQGLVVPNIKRVNALCVIEIASELARLHDLAKRGSLGAEDLSGGTFTLSNIGSIGGLFGIPVLMPNEVAIGAIGRLRQMPRFVDNTSDRVERAYTMQVLWSADHRIIDGATMTRFSNRWKDYLENPFKILL